MFVTTKTVEEKFTKEARIKNCAIIEITYEYEYSDVEPTEKFKVLANEDDVMVLQHLHCQDWVATLYCGITFINFDGREHSVLSIDKVTKSNGREVKTPIEYDSSQKHYYVKTISTRTVRKKLPIEAGDTFEGYIGNDYVSITIAFTSKNYAVLDCFDTSRDASFPVMIEKDAGVKEYEYLIPLTTYRPNEVLTIETAQFMWDKL